MAFTLIKLPDEPVVLITIDLPLDRYLNSVRSTNAHLSRLAAETSGVLYFVLDVADQDVAFSDILIGLDELAEPSSWINYSHVQVVVVGTHPMLQIARKRAFQQFRVEWEVFESRDDALAYVREALDALNE